jgi:hypothetical protein
MQVNLAAGRSTDYRQSINSSTGRKVDWDTRPEGADTAYLAQTFETVINRWGIKRMPYFLAEGVYAHPAHANSQHDVLLPTFRVPDVL